MKPLFKHGDNLYVILKAINRHNIEKNDIADKKLLGAWVKYLGGDHILLHQNKYLICETVQEAEVLEYTIG